MQSKNVDQLRDDNESISYTTSKLFQVELSQPPNAQVHMWIHAMGLVGILHRRHREVVVKFRKMVVVWLKKSKRFILCLKPHFATFPTSTLGGGVSVSQWSSSCRMFGLWVWSHLRLWSAPFLCTRTRHDIFHSVQTFPSLRLNLKRSCRTLQLHSTWLEHLCGYTVRAWSLKALIFRAAHMPLSDALYWWFFWHSTTCQT